MLLATDLDGTFLAGDPEARLRLYQRIAADPEVTLVFVTGRGLEAVLPILSDPTIPVPHYIIADVGATVVDGATRQAVQPLQSAIDVVWPGELAVTEALAGFERLQRQEVPQQRRCSYFCDGDAVTGDIHAAAAALGCDVGSVGPVDFPGPVIADHDAAAPPLRALLRVLTTDDCAAATGERRAFYQCMSSGYNHVYACGKAHPFEP